MNIEGGDFRNTLNEMNIPDGTEIYLEVEVEQPLSEQERLTRLNQIFGVWKNQTELDDIFAEIDTERHAYRGRALETLND